MNKKKRVAILLLMIILLNIFIFNSSAIYNNYIEVPGIYKASYNFKHELGKEETEISFIRVYGQNVGVIAEKDGHRNVLELKNEGVVNNIRRFLSIYSDVKSGSIEWWWLASQKNIGNYAIFRDRNGNRLIWTRFQPDGRIYAYNGSINKNLMEYEANQWYHWRVDFDCTTDTFNLYIDGVKVANQFIFNQKSTSNFGDISFYTQNATNYSFYLDAFGFSWDENYKVGDDLTLEKIIHPIVGLWSIIFSGMLAVTAIIILNPKMTITYLIKVLVKQKIIKKKEYMTFINFIFLIFKGREVVNKKKWDLYGSAKTSIEVLPEVNGFRESFKIYDNSDYGRALIRNRIVPYQGSGLIKWWWRITDPHKSFSCSLINSDLHVMISFRIEDGSIYTWNGNNYQILQEVNVNQWYYMQVDFNCTFDTFNVYIDRVKKAEKFFFRNQSNFVKFIEFYTEKLQYGYYVYVSDIIYSWDKDYFFF